MTAVKVAPVVVVPPEDSLCYRGDSMDGDSNDEGTVTESLNGETKPDPAKLAQTAIIKQVRTPIQPLLLNPQILSLHYICRYLKVSLFPNSNSTEKKNSMFHEKSSKSWLPPVGRVRLSVRPSGSECDLDKTVSLTRQVGYYLCDVCTLFSIF